MDRDDAGSQLRVAPFHRAPQRPALLLALTFQRGNAIGDEAMSIGLVVLLHP